MHSDADASSPHVAAADLSVSIGLAAAAQSYLSVPAIIEAARAELQETNAADPLGNLWTDPQLLAWANEGQDQVVSGKIRWQTKVIADAVEPMGFGLKHRFDFESYRAQPSGRTQKNPHACSSQLLVFQRGWQWSDLT